jgi:PRC-barrel domain
MSTGTINYAVLSFGGFLGMGDRLFAVPWRALTLDTANKRFTLNASKEQLKNAPGFDKDHWPVMADSTWASGVHNFYGVKTTGRIQ